MWDWEGKRKARRWGTLVTCLLYIYIYIFDGILVSFYFFYFFWYKACQYKQTSREKENNRAHREETTGAIQYNQLEWYPALP